MKAGDRKRFLLETYGCQMNTAESVSLAKRLHDAGWDRTWNLEETDLVILNTCAVRRTAENRIWGRLGFYGKQKQMRPFHIAVMGCMAERIKEDIRKRAPFVDYIVGVPARRNFIDFICGNSGTSPEGFNPSDDAGFCFDRVYGNENDFKAFVPIMHGCNNYCSYCIVPYVRGPEISRHPEEVFSECSLLFDGNVVELTLLGQNVNSYRYQYRGSEMLFPDLLEEIINRTPFPWIRFISSHPKDLSPALIRIIREHTSICRHIHLPVQHGSDTILGRMNRKYTRMQYMELVEELRSSVPDIALSTDIMIGFPGETEGDFRDTLDLMERVRFDDAFTYYYNPREGTAAASFPHQVSMKVKKERLKEVIALQRHLTLDSRAARIGKVAEVLVESLSKKRGDQVLGRTSRNEMIICPGDKGMIGTLGRASITGLSGTTLKGAWLE